MGNTFTRVYETSFFVFGDSSLRFIPEKIVVSQDVFTVGVHRVRDVAGDVVTVISQPSKVAADKLIPAKAWRRRGG